MKKIFVNELLVCVAALVATAPSLSMAQSGVPRSSYEKNVADGPNLGVESAQAPMEIPRQQQVESNSLNQGAAVKPLSAINDQSGSQKSKSAPRLSMRVSLYVSSKDKHHFEAIVRKALSLSGKNPGVVVTEVIHIGDYRNVSASIQDEMKARNIFFASMVQVPKRYNVQDSPTWILRDSQGEHIVEGGMAIEGFIGPQGEYREPERSMLEVAPTPTMGVKSF